MSRFSRDVFSFPLENSTDEDVENLLQCLWHWRPCANCHKQTRCDKFDCAALRYTRLEWYIRYYRQTTALYDHETKSHSRSVLSTHQDLCSLIAGIKGRTGIRRRKLLQELFGSGDDLDSRSLLDQERALDLAIQVMTMVDTTSQLRNTLSVEDGLVSTRWSTDLSFAKYMSKLFPKSDHPSVNKEGHTLDPEFAVMLKASVLQKQAGLKFRPTCNLRDHLKLDRDTRSIGIFHQTSFLKEHLRATRPSPDLRTSTPGGDDWQDGTIPRQLALEVLDSIQKIIFPLTDGKSKAILQTLVSRWALDPDCLRFDSASIRTKEEQKIAYLYFGARLADLSEEVQNPKPHGYIEQWLERKSGARYVMLATLMGVMIAIFLGILTLIVSVYQTYIGYMAWKHPVTNS